MRIACLSDLHGHLPKIPDCDLLLLAGDYSPVTIVRWSWFSRTFFSWLKSLPMPVVGVAGNHDLLFEEDRSAAESLPWTYLQDSGVTVNGLNIYGTPWQPRFFDWAFNASEDELAEKWALIPDDTDILILHGPPRGYGDFSPFGKVHTGSPSLLKRIEEIQPRLVIAGHIHSGYGQYRIGETLFLNCSLVDEAYRAVNPIQIVELSCDHSPAST